MTAVIPNTTVSILRGEETDEYGDPKDSDVSVAAGVPMSITENNQRVYVAAEGRLTIIRNLVGRVRPGFDVREKDRLRDDNTGDIYLVEGVSQPLSGIRTLDQRIFLRRIDNS